MKLCNWAHFFGFANKNAQKTNLVFLWCYVVCGSGVVRYKRAQIYHQFDTKIVLQGSCYRTVSSLSTSLFFSSSSSCKHESFSRSAFWNVKNLVWMFKSREPLCDFRQREVWLWLNQHGDKLHKVGLIKSFRQGCQWKVIKRTFFNLLGHSMSDQQVASTTPSQNWTKNIYVKIPI